MVQDQASSFFKTLFDFSFEEFITLKIIKILYGIGLFGAGISTLAFLISGFTSFGKGILYLILSPVVFILFAILTRVWLEIVIVLFNIAENIKEIARK